jgi:hypothetical protein
MSLRDFASIIPRKEESLGESQETCRTVFISSRTKSASVKKRVSESLSTMAAALVSDLTV